MGAERDDGSRLAAGMDARWDAPALERALGRVHREAARRRMRARVGGVALALVAAAVLALAWSHTSTPEAVRGAVIELADGSRIEPSEDGAAIVEVVSETNVRVRADRGAVRCEVTPRPERRFEVRAGDVTVTVLGTIFTVAALDDGRADVSVERGRVRVTWAGGESELGAGERGVFPLDAPSPPRLEETTSESTPSAPPSSPDEATLEAGNAGATEAASPHPSAEVSGAAALPSDWRALARAEQYDAAFVALPFEGRVDRVEDLLLAADVARLSGHPAHALPFLDRVLRDHLEDARAPVASFTRGRILAQLGRHREAATELTRAHQLEPTGSLAEDALGRAALEHSLAGDHDAAHRAAARYAAEHPEGRWSTRLRPLLESPSH